jgi:cystathionine beta-lyase/cystathionine gamma-synthase
LVHGAADKLHKHTFDIQGSANIDESIRVGLRSVAEHGQLPTTVIFVEIPTNPDQKIPDLGELVTSARKYKTDTGKDVLLLIDATFAPGSQVSSSASSCLCRIASPSTHVLVNSSSAASFKLGV